MLRRTSLLALVPLAFALGACGDDGGGGDAAFCEIIEDLEGGGTPSADEVDEAVDAAPDEIQDQMELLAEALRASEEADVEALEDFDEEEVVEAGEDVEDFARDECGVELDGASDEAEDSEVTTTTEANDGGDDETTTTSEADSGTDDGDLEAGEPDEPPSLDDPELDALAQECFEGSGEACDDLFFRTDVDSPEEEYGNTCGGRFDESPGLCSEAIGE